ncbi:MAG: hypothetical protein IPJ62_03350 [Betaproteobacteria bacterium]|nr:hypothetical protein [Betaproteobacteria bacterium]
MARVRKILRKPVDRIAYVIDANFLANKFIPIKFVTDAAEQAAIEKSLEWWIEIDSQLDSGHDCLRPDICIAETFKVLAKKYYKHKLFKRPIDHKNARDRLSQFLATPASVFRAANRKIRVHDVPTTRPNHLGRPL